MTFNVTLSELYERKTDPDVDVGRPAVGVGGERVLARKLGAD